jgi:hypothetical protein
MSPPEAELSEDEALRRLAALGANALTHVNGDLYAHLKGTCELLKRWGAPRHVCLAGLYHAVYGTAGFADQLLPLDRRRDVAAVIGDDAEELVYLFSACDRRDFYPRLVRRENPLWLRDRFSGATSVPPAHLLAGLCELTLANEAEIALQAGPATRRRQLRRAAALLSAVSPFVSAAIAGECRTLLAGAPVEPPLSPAA